MSSLSQLWSLVISLGPGMPLHKGSWPRGGNSVSCYTGQFCPVAASAELKYVRCVMVCVAQPLDISFPITWALWAFLPFFRKKNYIYYLLSLNPLICALPVSLCTHLILSCLNFTWGVFRLKKHFRPNINGRYSAAVLEVWNKYLKEACANQRLSCVLLCIFLAMQFNVWWK